MHIKECFNMKIHNSYRDNPTNMNTITIRYIGNIEMDQKLPKIIYGDYNTLELNEA